MSYRFGGVRACIMSAGVKVEEITLVTGVHAERSSVVTIEAALWTCA
jgi:hypothetical protein